MRLFITIAVTAMLVGCQLPELGGGENRPPSSTLPAPTIAPPIAPPIGTPASEGAREAFIATGEYDPRTRKVTLESALLGIEKSFYIYLPPGYDESPSTRYPVLYFFRGHEKEWVNPGEDPTRGGHNVIDVYEELVASGTVGPMILVFPGMSSDDNSVPGLATNMQAPERAANAAGIGSGHFEDYFMQEVVPYVDASFRTTGDPGERGVEGFSLGGFMATKIATEHYDKFGTVGAFDGLYFFTTSDCQLDDPRDNTFDMDMFAPAFDSPRDLAYAAENNAPTLICRTDPIALQSLEWFIQYGPESAEPNNSNYYRGEHLLEWLEVKGVANGFADPVLAGGHTWAMADEHVRQTLPLHWQAFND